MLLALLTLELRLLLLARLLLSEREEEEEDAESRSVLATISEMGETGIGNPVTL